MSSSRVNCSLVLPGYLGMVTRSSSKQSGRGNPDRPQQVADHLVRGQHGRGPAQLPLDDGVGRLVELEVLDPGELQPLDPARIAVGRRQQYAQLGADQLGDSPAYTRLLAGASRIAYTRGVYGRIGASRDQRPRRPEPDIVGRCTSFQTWPCLGSRAPTWWSVRPSADRGTGPGAERGAGRRHLLAGLSGPAPVDAGRGVSVVVARSEDGVRFEPVVEVHRDDFGAASFERAVLVTTSDGPDRRLAALSELRDAGLEALVDRDPRGRSSRAPGLG